MTGAQILTDLYGINYGTGVTNQQAFRPHDLNFADFDSFPVAVIFDGPEEGDARATSTGLVTFHPSVYYITTGETAANMATTRDSIRSLILGNATLWSHATNVIVEEIEPVEPDDRLLQALIFRLAIDFDYTV